MADRHRGERRVQIGPAIGVETYLVKNA
jgi:hypothetical protein